MEISEARAEDTEGQDNDRRIHGQERRKRKRSIDTSRRGQEKMGSCGTDERKREEGTDERWERRGQFRGQSCSHVSLGLGYRRKTGRLGGGRRPLLPGRLGTVREDTGGGRDEGNVQKDVHLLLVDKGSVVLPDLHGTQRRPLSGNCLRAHRTATNIPSCMG